MALSDYRVGSSWRLRGALRFRCDFGAAGHHGNQRMRHQKRQRDMDDDEQHDRGHAEEMDEARGLERLPNSASSSENWIGFQIASPECTIRTPAAQDADIEQLLHRVVLGRIVVGEPQAQRVSMVAISSFQRIGNSMRLKRPVTSP